MDQLCSGPNYCAALCGLFAAGVQRRKIMLGATMVLARIATTNKGGREAIRAANIQCIINNAVDQLTVRLRDSLDIYAGQANNNTMTFLYILIARLGLSLPNLQEHLRLRTRYLAWARNVHQAIHTKDLSILALAVAGFKEATRPIYSTQIVYDALVQLDLASEWPLPAPGQTQASDAFYANEACKQVQALIAQARNAHVDQQATMNALCDALGELAE